MMENQKGQKVKVLRSDNGGEYTPTDFKAYLAGEGIKHQLCISGQLKQNKVTERMNQTLTECVGSIRLQVDMLEGFKQRR